MRKAIKAQPVLAQICSIEVAGHRPDAGDNGYADAAPEHETARSLACLTSNAEVGMGIQGGDKGAPPASAQDASSFWALASDAGKLLLLARRSLLGRGLADCAHEGDLPSGRPAAPLAIRQPRFSKRGVRLARRLQAALSKIRLDELLGCLRAGLQREPAIRSVSSFAPPDCRRSRRAARNRAWRRTCCARRSGSRLP